MKINFNVSFSNYKGQPTQDIIGDKVAEALFTAGMQNNQIKNEDKYKAYKICRKISEAQGEIEISTEEATLIKTVCVNYLTAGGYGQLHELIEGIIN